MSQSTTQSIDRTAPVDLSALQVASFTPADVRALLTVERFTAWLKSKPPLEIVGICESPYVCPIASYLTDHSVILPSVDQLSVDWEITEEWWTQPTTKRSLLLPYWCVRFIKAVDVLHPAAARQHPLVSAADALDVLERLDDDLVEVEA